MSGTMYRIDKPTTLEDLLTQANYRDPNGPPQAATARAPSEVQTEGILSNENRQKLLDMLMKPEEPGPAPDVQKPKLLATILTGLGDSLSAGAGILGGTGFRSDFLGDYMARLDRQKEDYQKYKEDVADKREKAKLRTANYLLGESDKASDRAYRSQETKEQRAYNEEQRKSDQAARLQLETVKNEAESAKFEAQKKWDLGLQQARFSHDQAMKRLDDGIRNGDKLAERQQSAIGDAKLWIGSLADQIPQMLAGDPQNGIPPMTPDQIQTKLRRGLDAMTKIGLTGDARSVADAYVLSEIGTQLVAHQQNQDLAAGSPQNLEPVSPERATLGAIGSYLSPKLRGR